MQLITCNLFKFKINIDHSKRYRLCAYTHANDSSYCCQGRIKGLAPDKFVSQHFSPRWRDDHAEIRIVTVHQGNPTWLIHWLVKVCRRDSDETDAVLTGFGVFAYPKSTLIRSLRLSVRNAGWFRTLKKYSVCPSAASLGKTSACHGQEYHDGVFYRIYTFYKIF